MTSQMVVNIDTELKKKAMAMAKKQGLTMKALMGFLLEGYIQEEIEIGAKFNSFERDYGELEFEPLSKSEKILMENNKQLDDITLSIKQSLQGK